MSSLNRIAVCVLWPIPSLIVWILAWLYKDHIFEFSTSSTTFFYLHLVWYFTIILCSIIFLLIPYFLIFKNKIFRLILILVLFIILIASFKSSPFNLFIPLAPTYPGGHDIKYEYKRSGISEGAPNYLALSFFVSNSSNATERKKIAKFYTSVFLKNGLEFKTAHFGKSLLLLNCEEEIDYQIEWAKKHPDLNPEIKDAVGCQLRKVNDLHSSVIMVLSFHDNRITIAN